jgi:hypothetical protein
MLWLQLEKQGEELIMVSKQYMEMARTLFRVARNMADQTVADRLKALAGDYERRAEQASHTEATKAQAFPPAARALPGSIEPVEQNEYGELLDHIDHRV